MIDKKLLDEQLNKFEQFRVDFQFNKIEVSMLFNRHLYKTNQFLFIFKGVYTDNRFQNYNNIFYNFNNIDEKIFNFIYASKNKNIEYKYKGFFIDNLFHKNTNNGFWNKVNLEIKETKKEYSKNFMKENKMTFGKGRCIYIQTIVNKKMSESHKKYLNKKFKINILYLNEVQIKGFTIRTTNDFISYKRNKQLADEILEGNIEVFNNWHNDKSKNC